MKKCRTCLTDLPITEYYKHSRMLDGHLNICKHCTKKRVNYHRKLNIDKIRKYDVDRSKEPKRRMHINKVVRRYESKFPKSKRAVTKVNHAVKNGILKKSPCEICGNIKVHGHHDDYDKPLEVRWLCASHHRQWHVLNKPLNQE